MLSIPGFTHPVKDLFLEDALEATGFAVGRGSKWAKKGEGGGPGESGRRGACGSGGGGGSGAGDSGGASGGAWAEGYSEQTQQSLANIDESQVNTDLIEAVVAHVVNTRGQRPAGVPGSSGSGNGAGENHKDRDDANAILIFAPGVEEIGRICRQLQGSPRLRAGALVLPLHGGLPPSQQARVFQRPPKGERASICVARPQRLQLCWSPPPLCCTLFAKPSCPALPWHAGALLALCCRRPCRHGQGGGLHQRGGDLPHHRRHHLRDRHRQGQGDGL